MATPDITMIPTAKLIPYARNPRTHSEHQVSQIAASIKEFGWLVPVVVDAENVLIAGHGRVMAAQKLGMDKVPTIDGSHLNESQIKAFRIAENKLALNAGWDDEMLKLELQELIDADYGIDFTGFDDDELAKLIGVTEGMTDPDDAPEPLPDPISVKGDIWILGPHRVMCGDATSIDDVDRLMDGDKADMVFTDPPYNADYKSRGGDELLRQGIKNDALSDEAFDQFILDFLPLIITNAKGGASFYICCNWKDSYPRFYKHTTASGMNVSACIVWDKGSGGMGWQDYRYQYEFIIYGFMEGAAHSWYGDRTQTDIWKCNRDARQKYKHPTQKPVELVERGIKNSSKVGDSVLDPFGGSGTTIIACERISRCARLVELDPIYVDVIVRRWQDFTGKQAHLENDTEALFDARQEASQG
jgi:DNA modification methylase